MEEQTGKEKRRVFTPSEIRNKEFSKKLFGYDPDEVDSFLVEIANAYQELLKEIEKLKIKTPEYKTKELVERAKKEIEKIVEEKKKEKELLEKEKRALELEIEKLRFTQKTMYDRLKIAIIDMTKILEELKRDASGQKEEGRDRDRSEVAAQGFQEQSREGGSGEAESKGNGSSGGGEGQ